MSSTVKPVRFENHIDIRQGGVSAMEWMVTQTPLDRAAIEQVVSIGAVWLTRGKTQRLRDAQQFLKYGDQLHLYYDEGVLQSSPLEPELVNDQGAYSIWFKPEGMRGEGTRYGDHCSLARWVEKYYQDERSVDFIYRLDRSISGLMLIVHDKSVADSLSEQFHSGQLRIEYRAWVSGLAHFNHKLLDQTVRGKPARTLVTSLKQDSAIDQTLVAIRLETGRKHQIRQHLSAQGHPVIGDRIYGSGRGDALQLQVIELHFICPVKAQLVHIQLMDSVRIDLNPSVEMTQAKVAGVSA